MTYAINSAETTVGGKHTYADVVTGASEDGHLVAYGGYLFHLTDGATYQYLEAGTTTWAVGNYTTWGLAADTQILTAFAAPDGLVIFTRSGGVFKISDLLTAESLNVTVDTNLNHCKGLELGGDYYLTGVAYNHDGVTQESLVYGYKVNGTSLATTRTEIQKGSNLCYPYIVATGAKPLIVYHGYEQAQIDYTIAAVTFDTGVPVSIGTLPDRVYRPIKPLEVAGKVVLVSGSKAYSWDETAGLTAVVDNAELLQAHATGGYGDASTKAIYTPNSLYYTTDGVIFTALALNTPPTNVHQATVVSFTQLGATSDVMTQGSVATFMRANAEVLSQATVVSFVKPTV